ncbi:dephospho-CoA kinase [bacterium]|nr:dephospho-CoA kinase [bacterium]
MAANLSEAAGNQPDTGATIFIGITGTRGAGKSQVGNILRSKDVPVIDADGIGHEFLNGPNEVYYAVLERFGADLVDVEGGPINREKLGAIVFSDDQALCDLEALIHEPIFKLIEKRMAEQAGKPVVAVELPLLHEKGRRAQFDVVWCVVADEAVLIPRLMSRDGVSEQEARALMAKHATQEEKAAKSDVVIDNSGTAEELEAKVLELLAALTAPAEADAEPDAEVEPEAEPEAETDPVVDGESDTETPAEGDAASEDDSEEDSAEAHYQKRLRQFAEMSTEAVLDKMGKVATTGHKSARATTRMNVSSCEGDCSDGEHDQERELEVTVSMAVRNARVGGGCRKPVPPTPEPQPGPNPDPRPGPNPNPNPQPKPGAEDGKKGFDRTTLIVAAAAVMIAFFALLAFLYAMNSPRVTVTTPANPVVVVQQPVCPVDCDKPVKQVDPPVFRLEPPAHDTTVTVVPGLQCQPGVFRELTEEPGYAFRAIHNAVRPRISKYYERYGEGCKGLLLVGRDANKRLVIHQYYDANKWLEYGLVFEYFPNRTIQVDRFDGRDNIFTGRTVYLVDQNDRIVGASVYDGMRRLVLETTITVSASGEPLSVSITSYDANTRVAIGINSITEASKAVTYLNTNLLGYDLRSSLQVR